LDDVGLVEGRDMTIEYHWAEGHYERLPAIIADLVRRKASVIAATSTPAAVAAKAANTTIPVVFTTGGDPIKLGLVSSLNQPGSNFTGIVGMSVELASKRLQLMHEALPNAATIVLLVNPPNPLAAPARKKVPQRRRRSDSNSRSCAPAVSKICQRFLIPWIRGMPNLL
jgi:putative tryptophan/tyrosine transport system substrate-binding protein